MSLSEDIRAFAAQLNEQLPVPVTADPAFIYPPCVFVDIPTFTGRTHAGYTLAVPVIILVEQPADDVNGSFLLDLTPVVLDALGETEASPGTFNAGDLAYPAMTITKTLTLTRSS